MIIFYDRYDKAVEAYNERLLNEYLSREDEEELTEEEQKRRDDAEVELLMKYIKMEELKKVKGE